MQTFPQSFPKSAMVPKLCLLILNDLFNFVLIPKFLAVKHVTIKEIAQLLNLSKSTVSRALVDDKNVKKETKARVLALATELGYKPNPIALNLKYGKSNTIGVIVPEMITPFASEVISGIQEVLYAQGMKVIIAQSEENPSMERENLNLMEKFRVDGIIISLCHQQENEEEYLRIQKGGIPMIFYDRIPADLDVTKVIVNDYLKSFFLVEHLIRSGRQRIVHLKGPDYIYNSIERARGYKDALAKFKIPYDSSLVIKAGVNFDDGKKAIEYLINNNIDFDSVFAFTDTVAIAALNTIKSYKIKIPNQVAIAGFSGTILSTLVTPQISTVEQPLTEMGRTAARLMLNKIKNPLTPNETIILDAEIKLRESTESINVNL